LIMRSGAHFNILSGSEPAAQARVTMLNSLACAAASIRRYDMGNSWAAFCGTFYG
jgi:hypothetical protein